MSVARTGPARRLVRHRRVRKNLSGSTERPRLSVYRSHNHIYAQIIDDAKRVTVVAASTVEPELKTKVNGKGKSEVAGIVGSAIAERANAQGIKKVVFDRGGYKFHGRVKALAEAARAGGLVF